MYILKSIALQTSIFLLYFFLFSLLLFNLKGGADIGFVSFVFISLLVHFMILVRLSLVNALDKGKKPLYVEIATIVTIGIIFGWWHPVYLEFMWWLVRLVLRK